MESVLAATTMYRKALPFVLRRASLHIHVLMPGYILFPATCNIFILISLKLKMNSSELKVGSQFHKFCMEWDMYHKIPAGSETSLGKDKADLSKTQET